MVFLPPFEAPQTELEGGSEQGPGASTTLAARCAGLV